MTCCCKIFDPIWR